MKTSSSTDNLFNYHNLSIQDTRNQSTQKSTIESKLQKVSDMIVSIVNIYERNIKQVATKQKNNTFINKIDNFSAKLNQIKQKIIEMNLSIYSKEFIEILDDTNNILNQEIKENTVLYRENSLSPQVFKKKISISIDKILKNMDTLKQKTIKFTNEQQIETNNIAKSSRKDDIKSYFNDINIGSEIKKYCKSFKYQSVDALERKIDIEYVQTYVDFFNEIKTKIEHQQLKNKAHITETLNKLFNIFDDVTVNINNNKSIDENIPEDTEALIYELHNLIKSESNLDLHKKIDELYKLDINFSIKKVDIARQDIIDEEDLETRGILRKIWDFMVSVVTTIFRVLYNILLMPFKLLATSEQKKLADETIKANDSTDPTKETELANKPPDETFKNAETTKFSEVEIIPPKPEENIATTQQQNNDKQDASYSYEELEDDSAEPILDNINAVSLSAKTQPTHNNINTYNTVEQISNPVDSDINKNDEFSFIKKAPGADNLSKPVLQAENISFSPIHNYGNTCFLNASLALIYSTLGGHDNLVKKLDDLENHAVKFETEYPGLQDKAYNFTKSFRQIINQFKNNETVYTNANSMLSHLHEYANFCNYNKIFTSVSGIIKCLEGAVIKENDEITDFVPENIAQFPAVEFINSFLDLLLLETRDASMATRIVELNNRQVFKIIDETDKEKEITIEYSDEKKPPETLIQSTMLCTEKSISKQKMQIDQNFIGRTLESEGFPEGKRFEELFALGKYANENNNEVDCVDEITFSLRADIEQLKTLIFNLDIPTEQQAGEDGIGDKNSEKSQEIFFDSLYPACNIMLVDEKTGKKYEVSARVIASVNHMGKGVRSGHYTAITYGEKTYFHNDESVLPIDEVYAQYNENVAKIEEFQQKSEMEQLEFLIKNQGHTPVVVTLQITNKKEIPQ